MPMHIVSAAKINLHLRVGSIQKNGFHPVNTWMVTVGLFDNLDFTLESIPPEFDRAGNSVSDGRAGRVLLSCNVPALPCDESNLIVRAVRLLQRERMSIRGGKTSDTAGLPHTNDVEMEQDVVIRLQKSIPMGAGLGGGSSNAAMTLIALCRLWSLDIPLHRLSEMAAMLGSDVPFFLHGTSGICTGRGEIVQPALPFPSRFAMLMLPDIAMPTGPVYRRFDELQINSASNAETAWDSPIDWKTWSNLPADDLLPLLRNDLEQPAFDINPTLSDLRAQTEALLARPVRMSGSGSSLFTLYDCEQDAIDASHKVQHATGQKCLSVRVG